MTEKQRRVDDGGKGGGLRSRWESVAAALSTALVLGVIGYLAYEAVARPHTPPAVEVVQESVQRAGSGWVMEFRAYNQGFSTAAAVTVEGKLEKDGEEVETSEAVLDYIPGRATRRGGLFFREDPRAHQVELRAMGYQEP
ncbi:MAG TPA: TIGR02588 family protein [Longimicrobium sp.]|nr:TIGR02588 family protein [Longimicrobium sp.]